MKLDRAHAILAECRQQQVTRAQAAYIVAYAHHRTEGTMDPGDEDFVELTVDKHREHEPDPVKRLVRGAVQGWFTGTRIDRFLNSEKRQFQRAIATFEHAVTNSVIAELAHEYERALLRAGFQDTLRANPGRRSVRMGM